MIRLDNKMKFFFIISIAECRIVEVDLPIQNCIISMLLPRKTLQRLLNVFFKSNFTYIFITKKICHHYDNITFYLNLLGDRLAVEIQYLEIYTCKDWAKLAVLMIQTMIHNRLIEILLYWFSLCLCISSVCLRMILTWSPFFLT